MRGDLIFESKFHNNSVVILDCLGAGDQKNGRWLEESLNDMSSVLGRPGYCVLKRIGTLAQLVAELKVIESSCRMGITKPVLHVEAHGDPVRGLLISGTGEYVSWQKLSDLVSVINSASQNNAGLVLASCNGFVITNLVRINKPSPYHFLLAPDSKVSAGELRTVLTAFYKEIIQSSNLNFAMAELPHHYKRYLCTEWFCVRFAKFMKQNLSGKAKSAFTEEALNAALKRHGSEHITALRRAVKTYIHSPQALFESSAEIFLMGELPVGYDQFESFVKGQLD
ncbi:hypothetical protein [Pseudomonas sp. Irchel 3H7]|uniref:hypothetical protein n=1 Tax=Pseudomonas sp. Irchel 3H7 TaxID=2009042 RepID=UPI000BA41762|nr:hypothetical protein [Pseudomonas sp. Irchel 3H7]